jgi:EAL domain-containing protein (putative c-di-GMP-specific phosphodiesterase class I)
MSPGLLDALPLILARNSVPPEKLEIELTEGVLLDPSLETLKRLRTLREKGVSIAVDDFGKGYSSLNYLRSLPIQAVKIDRSLVADTPTDERSAAIVRVVVGLAREFGFRVVGEGVETEKQVEALRREGCDEAQGFFFCRPCSAEQLPRVLQEWRSPWAQSELA